MIKGLARGPTRRDLSGHCVKGRLPFMLFNSPGRDFTPSSYSSNPPIRHPRGPRHRRSGLQTIRHTLRIRTLKTHFLESCSHPHTCQQPCSATPLCCLGSPLRFKIKDCLGERMSLLRLKRMPPFQLRYKS